MKTEKIIIYRESFLQSFLADVATFGVLVGSFAINQYFINSKFLSVILLIMFMMFVVSKTYSKRNVFNNRQEAIDFINKD